MTTIGANHTQKGGYVSENQQWDIVSGVGITALAVAGGRALESQRSDRLINDPYAEALVKAANSSLALPLQDDDAMHDTWVQMTDYLAMRSRFFDDFFEQAAASGADQAVILASGLDTRAFRMSWPTGFRLFEIDQPLVLEFKDTVLADLGADSACKRDAVPVDLRDDWASALKNAGFDPGRPTAWLAEGLLPYLPAEAERQLLDIVHDFSAPGSRIAIECIADARSSMLDPELREASKDWGLDITTLFSTEERPDPAHELNHRGWKTQSFPATEVAAGFGREFLGYSHTIGSQSRMLTAELAR